jgi:hypothetical protein
MASRELVERVKQLGRAERSQCAAQPPSQAEFGQECDATSSVACERRAVAEDEPPTLSARLLGHGSEEAAGVVVVEREQSQLLVAVKVDDEPRRPAAELSATGVQKDRAPKAGDRPAAVVRAVRHWGSVRRERAWMDRR